MVCTQEARQSGRPGDKYRERYMEAGPCRRTHCIHLGSPETREAHYQDLHRHQRRSRPEASLCVYGKPDRAGGPVINRLQNSWKPVHAGGHIVCKWEAAGGVAGGQASGRNAFFGRYIAMLQEIYLHPSYLHCTKRLLADIHLTGVHPQRLLHVKNDHIGLEPLLIADRESLHILVPSVSRND